MSRQELASLLDQMLDEAGEKFSQAERARAASPPAGTAPAPSPASAPASPPARAAALDDVEALRDFSDEALCKVLAATGRDDVLTVLSGASDGLRRKILTNLSADSVRWLKQNLAYFDEPTRALLAAGRAQMLQQANKLLAAGGIARPAGSAAGTPDEETERFGAVVAELLDLLHERGHAALGGVATTGHPLLDEAVTLLARGADEATVAEAVRARKEALLAEYARRLDLAAEGALALARGEDADAFRKRLGT